MAEAPKVTAILGPTNTGKTFFAIERMLAHKSGMIGLPLRLLAREVYDRIVRLKSANEVALITGEEKILPKHARFYVCTVEAMPLEIETACLVVDDVYETGRTLEPYRDLERVRHMVWVSKAEPLWWQAVEVTDSAEWIVFPWESASAAAADEAVYRASRA